MRVATPPRSHLARQRATLGLVRASVASPSLDPRSVSRRRLTSPLPPRIRRENASESLSDMSTLLNNFREKTQRAGLVRPARSLRTPPVCDAGARHFPRRFPLPAPASTPGRRRLSAAVARVASWRTIRDPRERPTREAADAASRPDLPRPPPLPPRRDAASPSGVARPRGRRRAPSRHLQRHGRDHDHPHGRARDEARELHAVHPGPRRGCVAVPPQHTDSSLDRPPTLSRGASSVSYPSPPVVAFFAFAS